MSRYIDLDKAIPVAIQAVVDVLGHGISQIDVVRIAEKFEDVSTADVAEVRHGEWGKQKRNPEVMKSFHEMGLGDGMSVNSIYWTCSICGNWGTPNHKYCCSCGAKMDGERKENDL